MKWRTIVRPSGRLIRYREYGPGDFSYTLKPTYFGHLRKEFNKLVDPYTVGKRKRVWSSKVNRRIVIQGWKIILDRLMEKDRLILEPGRVLVIGIRAGERPIHNSWGEERNVSLHIQGPHNNFYFRMSLARRRKLRALIESGEVFHNAN